jgi:hypothetical protein
MTTKDMESADEYRKKIVNNLGKQGNIVFYFLLNLLVMQCYNFRSYLSDILKEIVII